MAPIGDFATVHEFFAAVLRPELWHAYCVLFGDEPDPTDEQEAATTEGDES